MNNIKVKPIENFNPKRWDNFFLKCLGGADPKPVVKGNMFMAKSEFERLKREQANT
jgi:hypothetical protein